MADRRYWQLAGSIFSVLPRAHISVSPSMEESPALPVADSTDLSPVHRLGMAFREHAAATNLTDWSTLNIQLYNFHAAGTSVHDHDAVTASNEPRGAASSTIICRSWNRGQCIASFALCHFAHKCQSCFGHNHVKDYPRDSSSQQRAESKWPPASHPCSRSKSR